MKMFVTSSEVVKQNNDMYSLNNRVDQLKSKRPSHAINETRNNSNNEGSYPRREISHHIDYCQEDLQRKASNSIISERRINQPQHYSKSINRKLSLSTREKNSSSTQAMSLPSSHVLRTQSEMQLSEDIAAAEWRDNCMFNRLVNGIKENQAKRLQRRSKYNLPSANATFDLKGNSDTRVERCLMSIVRHRYEDLQEISPVDTSSLLQSPDNFGEGNVIEPDEENAFEMFEMDDL